MIVPGAGRHIWEWYHALSSRCQPRDRDGVCWAIPPTEFLAWREATGSIVYPSEYDTLAAMDDAYRVIRNQELADYQTRQDEARRLEAEKRRGN